MLKRKGNLKMIAALFCASAFFAAAVPFSGSVAHAATKKASKITLNKSSATMLVGNSLKLKASKVSPANASKSVTWKTSNKKLATVTSKGVVKAKKAGTVKITGVSKTNPKAKASCKVTIYNKTKKLTLYSDKNYTLSIDEFLQLDAEVTSPSSKTQPVSWKSSDADIAKISKKGLVKALSEGTAKMTATSGGKSVSVKITVEEPEEYEPSGNETPVSTYIVAFDTSGGSAVNAQNVVSGNAAVRPADPVLAGYTFAGWYKDRMLTVAYDFASPVTENLTLFAKWEIVKPASYQVTFDSNGGSAVAPQTVETGKKAQQPENPKKAGRVFIGWYTDSSFNEAYDFNAAVTQNITLYAKWDNTYNNRPPSGSNSGGSTFPSPSPSPTKYTVTFNSNGGSAIASQTVAAGGQAAKPADPTKDGYTFVGWYTDEGLSKAYDFTAEVASSLVLYAKWEQKAIPDNGNAVTREQWITALSALFEWPKATDGQHSFDDFAQVANPDAIESCIRLGIVELKADGDNMVYFKPKETATREFAAYTAVRALKLSQSGAQESPAWSDKAELVYAKEDLAAVNAGILLVDNGKFEPNKALTSGQMDHALNVVKQILAKASVGAPHGDIQYVDGVGETQLAFEVDQSNKKVTVDDPQKVAGWKNGEVHVLKSSDGSQDIAVKIKSIHQESGKTVILYDAPALEEVVTSFDAAGAVSQGTFIPAEGVSFNGETRTRKSRAVSDGEIPLFGKKTISINRDDVSFSGSLDIKNLEYRFVASPSWHLVTIDEVYLALNSSLEYKIQFSKDLIDEKIKIGTIVNIPLGYGFNVSGDIYLIFKAGGSVEVGLELTEKSGIQYAKNHGIRPVHEISVSPVLDLKAEAKAGLAFEVNANFLGFLKLAAVGTEAGIAAEGTPEHISVSPMQICLDATEYVFLTLYAQIGPDEFNIKYEHEIFNSDNSIWKKNQHFEETGLVPECTRGSGDYEGYVKRADDNTPIHNAKIQVLQDGIVKDTTYSDLHGYFKGLKLKKGTYTIGVSARGFRPYRQTFHIVGGQTTALETQLMIGNELELPGRHCSGVITDAFTGSPLPGAVVTVKTNFLFVNNEVIAQTSTGQDGSYQFQAEAGSYTVTVKKDGYVENSKDFVIFQDRNDLNIFLSPQNQLPVAGDNLRVVLHWGLEPRDLDSHLVGPMQEGGNFHIFYQNMEEGPVKLDVDDTDGEGPETISVSKTVEGLYSYYVHDYSNRYDDSSTALSSSGAYIELYTGNTMLYRISIPQGKGGTVWHIFDYNTQTGRIDLVNEFSYESDPELVGIRSGMARRSSGTVLKDYELEGRK